MFLFTFSFSFRFFSCCSHAQIKSTTTKMIESFLGFQISFLPKTRRSKPVRLKHPSGWFVDSICNISMAPRREDGSERSRELSSGGASGYSSHNCSKTKKIAILKFCYFIGKNLSFLTGWLKKKIWSNFDKKSNIYWKFHLVLNDVNYKSQVDKVDMLDFGYHGEWYTLLIINIIGWNDLEKFV